MSEIEFSFIANTEKFATDLIPVIERFERQNHCRVKLLRMKWEEAWPRILDAALHAKGPDISVIGTTWLSSLVAMNAIRPFSPREIQAVGGEDVFYPACWSSRGVAEDPQIWSMPWEANAYVLFYRRDVLEKAGVDEWDAFVTPQAISETLVRIQASGWASPWLVPLGVPAWDLLHSAASWIWGAGGAFLSSDTHQTRFAGSEALAGLKDFFALFRFIGQAERKMKSVDCMQRFVSGETAVVISAATYGLAMIMERMLPDLRAQVSTAPAPGIPVVGGSNLVIWRYTSHIPEREKLALRLAQYLSSHDGQSDYFQCGASLPVRPDVLENLILEPSSLIDTLKAVFEQGRTYPSVPMWSRVEGLLSQALMDIAHALLDDPNQEIEPLFVRHLAPVARRLDMTLR
jgi:multiple sugar transport system substrate-binding protein